LVRIQRPGLVSSGHKSEQLDAKADWTMKMTGTLADLRPGRAVLHSLESWVRARKPPPACRHPWNLHAHGHRVGGEGMPFTKEGSKSAEWEFETREAIEWMAANKLKLKARRPARAPTPLTSPAMTRRRLKRPNAAR
jgi:hypothetical protein